MEFSVLEWLCESGGMGMLQKQCHAYKERAQCSKAASIFTFHHTIDVMLLLEHDAKLGELVLHHPSSAWPLFQKVCFIALKTLEWLPVLKSPSQLVLLIRLVSVPNLPGYKVEHVCDLPSSLEEPKFYQITGTVYSMSKPEKYTEHAVFSCPTEGCSDSYYISVHVVGASEAATVGRDYTCYTCGSQLVEDIACRMLADKIYLILIPRGIANFPVESLRLQGVCVVLRRELCMGIRPGLKLTIIGVPTHRLAEQSLQTYVNVTIEANNVFIQTNAMPSLPTIADSIADILKACRYSPWVFSATLAFSFAGDICPYGCYHRLKMALLLSLVSAKTELEQEIKSTINLLVYGSDSIMIHQLLTVASSLAPTAIYHNSLNDLVATSRKNQIGTFIDGGSLLLANEGVCTIMNLSSYKKDTRETLQKALETDQLVFNIPKQEQGAYELTWKMNCTVWAHVDQLDRKKSFPKADTNVVGGYSLHDTSAICKVLADQFDLVVVNDPMDVSTQDHLHDTMMDCVVNKSKCQHFQPSIFLQTELQQFLGTASLINVKITEDASELLKSYYASSRKVRTSVSHGTEVPIRALTSMKAIACAHARINLRKEALVEDAVMSIFLYEESLTSRFGHSVLGLSPCPHFKPNTEAPLYIGKQFDAYMKRFYKEIIDFCSFQGITNVHQHEE